MTATPKLGLTLMATNTAQKEAVFNEGLISLEAIVCCVVISRTLTTPPGTPADGDTYIPATGATGAWSGWANSIAFYYNGWRKLNVPTGMRVFVTAENLEYRWDGTSWNPLNRKVSTKTADYTLVLGDNGGYIRFDKTSAINCTVPANATVAYAVGSEIDIAQVNTGILTVVADVGVTINAPNGLNFNAQYQRGRLIKTATDTWELVIFNKQMFTDIDVFIKGTPTVSVPCYTKVFTRKTTFPINMVASQGYGRTPPATGAVNFDVQKAGVSVGTISFALATNTATFTMATATTFNPGDVLDIVAPASLDSMADIAFNLLGTLG